MYAFITGLIRKIEPTYIILENNNIGYYISISNSYNYKLNELSTIYIHQQIKDDSIILYGFNSEELKSMFLKLITVNGVGPKTALSMLSSNDVEGIVSAINSNNITYLTKFPGIGKKTASQIILDLKGKVSLSDSVNSNIEDARLALIALGYTNKVVLESLIDIDSSLPVEEIIKLVLAKLVNRLDVS